MRKYIAIYDIDFFFLMKIHLSVGQGNETMIVYVLLKETMANDNSERLSLCDKLMCRP